MPSRALVLSGPSCLQGRRLPEFSICRGYCGWPSEVWLLLDEKVGFAECHTAETKAASCAVTAFPGQAPCSGHHTHHKILVADLEGSWDTLQWGFAATSQSLWFAKACRWKAGSCKQQVRASPKAALCGPEKLPCQPLARVTPGLWRLGEKPVTLKVQMFMPWFLL